MKTKRLQLMIMATLFLGVNIGGASVAHGATLQNKSAVVTKSQRQNQQYLIQLYRK